MATLKEYLEAEGISQTEFAQRTKDSVQNVNRYVKLHRIPGREKVIRIHEATDGRVSFADWYRGTKPSGAKNRRRRGEDKQSKEIMSHAP